MKLKLLRWLLPAIVPAALMFGAASAKANDYDCSLSVPTNVTGDANISSDGDCIINHSVTATGAITFEIRGSLFVTGDLTAQGNNIGMNVDNDIVIQGTGNITSGTVVYMKSVNGLINVIGKIKANTTQPPNSQGNVLLQAAGNIATGDIITGGDEGMNSPWTGSVQIDANMGGANVPFVIGGTGGANGINGSIDTRSTTGGGVGPITTKGGVRITNGTAASTGGIVVANSTSILVQASNSKSGWIILNARSGKITLQGNLNADGASGKMAGNIVLLADTVEADDGVVISASQTNAAPASGHQILIATKSVKYSGANGLQIHADGQALSSVVSVYLLPFGNINAISNDSVMNLLWSFSAAQPIGQVNSELAISGDAEAPITVSANGDNTKVFISAYPIVFTGGDVTIEAKGKNNHVIQMGYFNTFVDKEGLVFLNTGRTLFDANATNNGNGGTISINVDKVTFLSRNHIFRADGPNNGDGNGGNINFVSMMINLEDEPKVFFSADGAESGQGNGGNLFLQTENNIDNFNLGKKDFSFSARGGATGNGGSAIVLNSSSVLTRVMDPKENEPAIDVSASSGDGGVIRVSGSAQIRLPKTNYFPNKARDFVAFDARGHGSGIGGNVQFGSPYRFGKGENRANLLALVKVDGGTAPFFDGRITVDVDSSPVSCRQWRLSTTWPKTYWNCYNPDSPGSQDSSIVPAAQSLTDNFKNILGATLTPSNPQIELFVMDDMQGAYEKFFFLEPTPDAVTFGISNTLPNRVAASFVLVKQNGTLVSAIDASGSSTIVAGAIVHELGHHVDRILGQPSAQPDWTTKQNQDFSDLNAKQCAQVFYPATCTQFPGMNNKQRFKARFPGIGFAQFELFAALFENVFSDATGLYAVEPELEQVLREFTRMRQVIIDLKNTPVLVPVE